MSVFNGEMYIICNDTPIQKIEDDKSVAYVLNEINNVIDARLSYEDIRD